METKDPGYYRKLIENIEGVNEMEANDKARARELVNGLRTRIKAAHAANDPKAAMDLLYMIANGLDDIEHFIRTGTMP